MSLFSTRTCGALLALSLSFAVAPSPALAQEDAAAYAKAVDDLWPRRDAADAAKLIDQKLAEAAKAHPDDVGILWRRARWSFWRADISSDTEFKAKTAKAGWDLAEQALKKEPDNAEARYWAAVSCGTYGDAIGVVTALRQGIEGKFRANLDWSVDKTPGYEYGGPRITLGRYYATLPWPKNDEEKAIDNLRKVIKGYPKNLRARLYLAEVLMDEGEKEAKEALALVEEILAATPGAYDAPEERHIQKLAKDLKPKIQEELE